MKVVFSVFIILILNIANAKKLKIGVLAPAGTTWAKNLKKMAAEVKSATAGAVTFKIFYGGSQGDESVVLSKMHTNRLQGGVFTGKTLGDITGDIRVIELPFLFNHDTEKAKSALDQMSPYFSKKLEENSFKNLGIFEIGPVYFVSQTKTESLNSLKGLKIWSWDGDLLANTMAVAMDLISVQLPLPEVLSSLSSGVIQAAYAPPVGIVALQWNTKIKYLVNHPISYSVGAFLISNKAWSKISKDNQGKIEVISKKYIDMINTGNRKDNADALSSMKSMGIEFLNFSESDKVTGKMYRDKVVSKLVGNLFSKEAWSKLNSFIK